MANEYGLTCSVQLSDKKDCVIINVKGNITIEFVQQYLTEAHNLGREYNIRKFLIDVTQAKSLLGLDNIYSLLHVKQRKDGIYNTKAVTALLTDPNDHSHDHVEIIAQNHGLRFKKFTKNVDAMKYLADWELGRAHV